MYFLHVGDLCCASLISKDVFNRNLLFGKKKPSDEWVYITYKFVEPDFVEEFSLREKRLIARAFEKWTGLFFAFRPFFT